MEQKEMRALLDLSVEAVNYVYMVMEGGDIAPATDEILENLCQIAARVEGETRDNVGLLHTIHLYAKNVQAAVEEARLTPALFKRVFMLEIRPYVLEMNHLWHLVADVLLDADKREQHRLELEQTMRALHNVPQKSYLYDATIVLCAYNKLEYTKAAAESIFAHTDFSDGRIELITINNGSDDGTREYFESLPHTKKINLKYNVLGINAYRHLVEGKYLVGFSNDVIATPNWLENLIAAMESDERIAMAVPTCNSEGISNDQGVSVPYRNVLEDMEKMQVFAASYNHRNPALWEEISQLMPFLSITRTDIYQMGLIDPIYTRVEFVDDDMSTLLRRTGWRQLLLKDTFMHHFGGVTLGEGRHGGAGNALDEMRRVYYEKWGVDAWDSRGDFTGAENVLAWHDFRAGERVLMLEPRFGHLACDFVNAYRWRGFVPHMTAAVFDERYLQDTSYLFNETMSVNGIEDLVGKNTGQYDIISAGCYLDELPLQDVIADLARLYGLLTLGGILILPVRNPRSAYELAHLIRDGKRDVYCGEGELKLLSSVSDQHLLTALRAHPYLSDHRIQVISFAADKPLVERLLRSVDEQSLEAAEEILLPRMFFLGIFKRDV